MPSASIVWRKLSSPPELAVDEARFQDSESNRAIRDPLGNPRNKAQCRVSSTAMQASVPSPSSHRRGMLFRHLAAPNTNTPSTTQDRAPANAAHWCNWRGAR